VRRRAAAVGALAAAALVSGGCGGAGGDTAGAARTPDARPPVVTSADPAPGRVLARLARAARRGDTGAIWALLSHETQATLGPDRRTFARGAGHDLVRSIGRLNPAWRVTLSRRIGGRWGLGAVSGTRTIDGERSDFVYAAALVRERGAWRIELGGIVLSGLRPGVLDEVPAGEDVRIRVRAAAGARVRVLLAWLDGRPVALDADSETPFAATGETPPRRPAAGRHDLVAFAATVQGPAAVGWPFRVTP
jgi:hypothetical protein